MTFWQVNQAGVIEMAKWGVRIFFSIFLYPTVVISFSKERSSFFMLLTPLSKSSGYFRCCVA